VTPHGVRNVEPHGVVMSFVMPDRDKIQKDVLTSFCQFLHVFPSKREGDAWVAEHPGARVLTLEAAFELGWHKNRLQYPDVVL
jgi:alkylmercury lyase